MKFNTKKSRLRVAGLDDILARLDHAERRHFTSCVRLIRALPLVVAVIASPVMAAFPDHPITLIVPYAPSGAVDGTSRLVAQELGKQLNESVVVENRAGAGSVIGVDFVARSKPDGYTLLVVGPALVINTHLQAKVPYKLSGLQAVSTLTASPLLLSTSASSPIKSLADLVAASKERPNGLTFASPGVGTTPHMGGELLHLKTGAKVLHVPYKGSGPAMSDLISGQVDFAFTSVTAGLPFVRQGRLRGLGTSGLKRLAQMPELPTIAEATGTDFNILFWTTLFVPIGTPPDVVDALNVAVKKVYLQASFLKTLDAVGETPSYSSVADATRFVQSEDRKWATVIGDAHITAN
jgi:tripartite-type tricarboxylate transporter receptor subunit TctC